MRSASTSKAVLLIFYCFLLIAVNSALEKSNRRSSVNATEEPSPSSMSNVCLRGSLKLPLKMYARKTLERQQREKEEEESRMSSRRPDQGQNVTRGRPLRRGRIKTEVEMIEQALRRYIKVDRCNTKEPFCMLYVDEQSVTFRCAAAQDIDSHVCEKLETCKAISHASSDTHMVCCTANAYGQAKIMETIEEPAVRRHLLKEVDDAVIPEMKVEQSKGAESAPASSDGLTILMAAPLLLATAIGGICSLVRLRSRGTKHSKRNKKKVRQPVFEMTSAEGSTSLFRRKEKTDSQEKMTQL